MRLSYLVMFWALLLVASPHTPETAALACLFGLVGALVYLCREYA